MRATRIRETKYKGYLIRPAITGFRVYRKEYFVAEYPTLQIAKARIDRGVEKKMKLLKNETPDSDNHNDSDRSGQIDLF